ncbi:MAG: SDR family oxidoreductase [Flavobacteriales bacterium]|jgi:UDP-N-acetylglucosamine 4-epimerase|nr:SDR family oxidoreductase [Flavobacteriales bacterium]
MYLTPFHAIDISNSTFLITGGAGFVGSNIAEYLIKFGAGKVRVLDNLSEGKLQNIEPFLDLPNFEFINGDISNSETCQKACEGIDYITHQAALGSVPRSLETPLLTNEANVTGFLNMLTAAKDAKVKRFVYASSSSVYGDSLKLPKVEEHIGAPLSPYAASKFVNEVYAGVYALNYGIEVVGLRYFNIFGPNQKPDGPYAAVIPLFMDALLKGKSPFINGDGEQSRDFTFVENAVQANIRGMFSQVPGASNRVYNIAFGEKTTVNQLYFDLKDLVGSEVNPTYRDPRKGDVQDSLADISKAKAYLGYNPQVSIKDGLEVTLKWFAANYGPTR